VKIEATLRGLAVMNIGTSLRTALVVLLGATPLAAGADIPAAAITPLPMQIFCRENPYECLVGSNTALEWSAQLSSLLLTTNSQVNGSIVPRLDPTGTWEVGPRRGDCNDYAVTKRSVLIGAGVPPGALRLAITTTPGGEPHAILLVKTSAGDMVMDNLGNALKSLGQSGYTIRSMSTANPMRWVRF
jgi:predicted transglutaminase-like cysteine proteinase